MTVWLATGNIHKKKELKEILSVAKSLELKIPSEEGITFDPDETGNSFLENAIIKAEELYRLLGKGQPVIADDSGICVDALDGKPGIYSARYGGKKLSDTERNARLLAELGDNPLRSSRFVCAMVLYCGASRFYAAQETLEGELVPNIESARGTGGFGYDPVLYIPELGRTVAELSDDEKNRLSHRGKAGRVIGRILSGLKFK
jgi:XTP/dITP diphosphohydrolase